MSAAIHRPTAAEYADFGRAAAAILGAALEWDADHLEAIAEEAARRLGVPVGDQGGPTLKFWRDVADAHGIDYDDNGELCRVCDELNDDGEGQDGMCGDCADRLCCPICSDERPNPRAKTCGDRDCVNAYRAENSERR